MRLAILPAACVVALVCAPVWAAAPANKDEEPPEVRYAAMLEREYGPLGTTTAQILGHESSHEPITLVGALTYRINAKPAQRRSAVERKIAAVYTLQAEVNNGGFEQYFFNDSGDEAAMAMQGLRDIGSTQGTKLMQRALAAFPGGKPPADRLKRQALLQKILPRAKATWSSCDNGFYLLEDLGVRTLAYAKKNRAQISLP